MSSSLRDLLSLDGFRSSSAASSATSAAAAISILSGHLRQFSGDPSFRRRIHHRCSAAISSSAAVSTLYLAVAAALQGDDAAAASHLLLLFSDSTRLARKTLLPELWKLFFLPHLLSLHLSFKHQLSSLHHSDLERESLHRVYEDKLDLATLQIAVKYRSWLLNGKEKSTIRTKSPIPSRNRSPFRFLSCRSSPNVESRRQKQPPSEGSRESSIPRFDRAVNSISNSRSLRECEMAVEEISRAWIGSGGDPAAEAAISTVAVAEGLLEVLFASRDEKILETAMALLADLVAKSESNRNAVLRTDPELETFLKLFRNRRLFLKAAVLLYLIKPRAENLSSPEWIPLILKVLEHGDQRQRLFSVQCRPRSAAFYFLDQILSGFDADRNAENAKQVFAGGGLEMLMKKFEEGTDRQIYSATSILVTCIRSEKACREFLVEKMNKASVIEILAGNRLKSRECALSLLVELISLCRRTKVRSFLQDLKNDGCLNAMHVLLMYLQRAPAEQRPLAAAILLQIDLLLGDPMQYSIHREESIDALIEAMDYNSRKKVQESCSRALCILCCRFSKTGEASMEDWLLEKSGFNGIHDEITNQQDQEEEAAMEDWGRRFSSILSRRGSERFSASLADCLAHGIPSLARSCLVMAAWLSCFLSPPPNKIHLRAAAAWSPLIPPLLDSLSFERAMEERVLAAFSLRNLIQNSEFLAQKILPLERRSVALLRDLAEATSAAREILSADADDRMNQKRF